VCLVATRSPPLISKEHLRSELLHTTAIREEHVAPVISLLFDSALVYLCIRIRLGLQGNRAVVYELYFVVVEALSVKLYAFCIETVSFV